jgi:hypothetical protein
VSDCKFFQFDVGVRVNVELSFCVVFVSLEVYG